jgi:hypothetical protein
VELAFDNYRVVRADDLSEDVKLAIGAHVELWKPGCLIAHVDGSPDKVEIPWPPSRQGGGD